MSIKTRYAAGAAALLAGGMLTLGLTASSALAGVNPSPTETVTVQPVGNPCPTPTNYKGDKPEVNCTPAPEPTPTQFGGTPCPTPTIYRGDNQPDVYNTCEPSPRHHMCPPGEVRNADGVCVRPVPVRQFKRLQEDLDLEISTTQPNGYVLADGPVVFNVGRDQSISDTLDKFYQGGNSVLVRHAGLDAATWDAATCTLVANQSDQPFEFYGGTGADVGKIVNGQYTLEALWSFGTTDGRCNVSGLFNGETVNPNASWLPQPKFFDIAVQGVGYEIVPVTVKYTIPPCQGHGPQPLTVADYNNDLQS